MSAQVQNSTVRVSWFCGHYYGAPKWRFSGDWVKEPDECCEEFETEHDKAEWDDGSVTAKCPKCGAELTQQDDSPEIVGEQR